MNRKMAAMFASMLIALSIVGGAYALWFDVLLIDGSVDTGFIGATFHELGASDNEALNKDVSRIECYVEGHVLHVDVFNAYPCITYINEFEIENTGSIPIHFWIGQAMGTGLEWVTVEFDGTAPYQLHPGLSLTGRVIVHLDNTAEQRAYYSFTVDLVYHQYNEVYPMVP